MFTAQNFTLSNKDMEEIKKWDNPETGHKCKARVETFSNGDKYKYWGAIGGGLSVKFTPTSIGTFKTIICSCGSKLDLSDNF